MWKFTLGDQSEGLIWSVESGPFAHTALKVFGDYILDESRGWGKAPQGVQIDNDRQCCAL